MTDEAKAKPSAGHGLDMNSPAFKAAILDVLVRGLDIAKQNPDGSAGVIKPDNFCAFAYGEPGHFCFIGYVSLES